MKTRIVGPLTVLVFAGAIVLHPGVAIADPITTSIYSTFGSGDTFSATGYAIGGFPFPQSEAGGFTSANTFTLDSVRIAAFSGGGQGIVLSVATSVNGAPGTPLETFLITPPKSASILTVNSVLHPTLQGGALYWLVAEPTNPAIAQTAGWNFVETSEGPVAARDGNLPWKIMSVATEPAFEIVAATSTPEPATLALFAVGAAGIFVRRRR